MEGVEEAIISFIINYHLLFKTPKANETTLIVINPKKKGLFLFLKIPTAVHLCQCL